MRLRRYISATHVFIHQSKVNGYMQLFDKTNYTFAIHYQQQNNVHKNTENVKLAAVNKLDATDW